MALGSSSPAGRLHSAVLSTVVYADGFDFPLLPAEVHRDLIGLRTTMAATESALDRIIAAGDLEHAGAYVVLPGRRGLADLRRERAQRAARMASAAARLGTFLSSLPYVRMVGLTGSLAVGNPDAAADYDYLLVTAPGRLWTVRALAVLLVRLARRAGLSLCPNYLLTTRALALPRRDLYTAHELAQVVPLTGAATYQRLLAANAWATRWLPNRFPLAAPPTADAWAATAARASGEALLRGSLGDRFERWEAARKQARLSRSGAGRFTAEVCEGHFGMGRRRTLPRFAARCAALGIALPARDGASLEMTDERDPVRPVVLFAL